MRMHCLDSKNTLHAIISYFKRRNRQRALFLNAFTLSADIRHQLPDIMNIFAAMLPVALFTLPDFACPLNVSEAGLC